MRDVPGADACPAELLAGMEAFLHSSGSGAAVPAHLTYQEIFVHVDRQLIDEDTAEVEHTRECRKCTASLAEMEALQREMQPHRNRRVGSGVFPGRATVAWKGAYLPAGAAAFAALVWFVVRQTMQ